MSDVAVNEETFASGRYSKRKRTQVTYHMDELDVSDTESDLESVPAKKRKAVAPKKLPKSKIFPFLQLPAEIRNMIYGYTLEDPSGINLVASFRHRRRTVERISPGLMSQIAGGYYSRSRSQYYIDRNDTADPVELVPSLLAVSKQVYHEGRDVLYNNEFRFADTTVLYHFMLNISPAGAKQLKHLRIMSFNYSRGMTAYNNACFAVLGQATNLKTLHIDQVSGRSGHSRGAAAKFYRDAFPWLEAVGAAKGKFDAGVELLQIDPDVFDHVYWRCRGAQRNISPEDKHAEFMTALRKLLQAQQKRVMGVLGKRGKKA
ncbi:hypothetical protein HBI56_089130 [Parastagonospora nodorum]|uniref:DUF7730 domain-containing protein n=2 Tax=Phaeosphaeria nodorum (strain SN15 / ATCC MYA-4574 / FGSC 10173) TaxID=321614 RepID=A0A7U2FDM0_PHANO|nr:hypothetical protein SNOG_10112 [Parastagonospora nodorum SN15]KAH3912987.1 hypothetical protein HBH56_110330 [Parastagonospora nodorum]EAT82447.1 hypothetical protein SNOG_10112 [Parastagonospora nodorum SN15]KAH3925653.1 hypothetical protein HBH54_180010 [Parastagonospora nodorum]KAH3950891.1 hypothetical protein HBH53_066030 [Parastagonospora nodorum]KAH3974423.1 hypothetical protein HBH51_092210 [Parastagonospora nodorum]